MVQLPKERAISPRRHSPNLSGRSPRQKRRNKPRRQILKHRAGDTKNSNAAQRLAKGHEADGGVGVAGRQHDLDDGEAREHGAAEADADEDGEAVDMVDGRVAVDGDC